MKHSNLFNRASCLGNLIGALLGAFCLTLTAWGQPSQPPPQPPRSDGSGVGVGNFLTVQRVDDVLYGVDSVSLEILDQRHVQGTFVRVSVERPTPILGYTRFVADCHEPARISLVSSSNLTGKTHPDGSPQYIEVRAEPRPPDQMEYFPGTLMDGTQLVTEFACRLSLRPGSAREVAQQLFDEGGPPDVKRLNCTLTPDGGALPVADVPVRYSESAQAVAVNHQWLASSVVTPKLIQFGSGYDKWTIERDSLRAQLLRPGGLVRFASRCHAL